MSGSELPSKVRIYGRVLKPVVLACVVEWPLPVEERVVRHKLPDIDEDVEVRCYIFRYSGLCIGLGCREDVDIRAILAQLKIELAIVHRIAIQQGEPVFFREFHCSRLVDIGTEERRVGKEWVGK